MAPPPPFEARLLRAGLLTPSVRELVFERVDGQPMVFEPGQWVNVFLPVASGATPEIKRSYSIASAPDGSPQFEIAVTRVKGGVGSEWLHATTAGVVLLFSGPQGFFTRPLPTAAPSLMIATGTGVTPLRSMMRAAFAAHSRTPMWVLLGVRHESDLLYGDELREAALTRKFVRFAPTVSQPSSAWKGRRGYVQTHLRELWAELNGVGPSAAQAYVCGLHRMVGSVREILRAELGVARERVHTERYD